MRRKVVVALILIVVAFAARPSAQNGPAPFVAGEILVKR